MTESVAQSLKLSPSRARWLVGITYPALLSPATPWISPTAEEEERWL